MAHAAGHRQRQLHSSHGRAFSNTPSSETPGVLRQVSMSVSRGQRQGQVLVTARLDHARARSGASPHIRRDFSSSGSSTSRFCALTSWQCAAAPERFLSKQIAGGAFPGREPPPPAAAASSRCAGPSAHDGRRRSRVAARRRDDTSGSCPSPFLRLRSHSRAAPATGLSVAPSHRHQSRARSCRVGR